MTKKQVVLKREEPPLMDSANSSMRVVHMRYGECQKNHAANVGGYAVDGCREFMASSSSSDHREQQEDQTTEAASLTCAACGCHRNFHRRVVETTDHQAAAATACCSDCDE